MSLEQLVIALVVLLPLLEGVIRVLQTRTRRRQERQPDAHSGQPSARRSSSPLPEREVDEEALNVEALADIPPLPSVPAPSLPRRRDRPERLVRREGRRAGQARPSVPDRPQGRAGGDAAARIGPARGLRRAIVLTAILGSCRALEPNNGLHGPS